MLKMVVIQLTDKQLDALNEFKRTRSIALAVEILDNIIDDLKL